MLDDIKVKRLHEIVLRTGVGVIQVVEQIDKLRDGRTLGLVKLDLDIVENLSAHVSTLGTGRLVVVVVIGLN